MKKICFVICIIAFITCLTGIPYLVEGIAERGFTGVNYGRIFFPLLTGGVSLWLFKK